MEFRNLTTTQLRNKIYKEDEATQIFYYSKKKQTLYQHMEQDNLQRTDRLPYLMKFKPCENLNNLINKKKIQYICDGVIYQGSGRDSEEKICSVDTMNSGVHTLEFQIEVPIDLIRKKEDHFTQNVPINNAFLRLPTFKVGIVEDGEQDNDVWKNNWAFKRLFGNLGDENKGMISQINGQWEYKSNFENELERGKFNIIKIQLDFNEGTFTVQSQNLQNKHMMMKKFLPIKNNSWKFYFSWSFCKSKLEVLDYTYKE